MSRRRGTSAFNAECGLFAAALPGGIVVAAGTGAAMAGRVTSFAPPGAGAHSRRRAGLHLAGLHPVRFHLVRFHLGTGGGSARSDVAFARSPRSRLHLCRRDRRRPEQRGDHEGRNSKLDRMKILLLWISDAGVQTCGADLGSSRFGLDRAPLEPHGSGSHCRAWEKRKRFKPAGRENAAKTRCDYHAPRKRFGRCARSRRQAWRPEGMPKPEPRPTTRREPGRGHAPDQGIVRDERGQEQPRDKERAQQVSRTDPTRR